MSALALLLLGAPLVQSADVLRWDAALVVDDQGTELPFGLELLAEERGWSAFLVNDPERIRVPEVEWDRSVLRLGLPHYRSEIRARLVGDELAGTWTKVRGKDQVARVPFRARTPAPADARPSGTARSVDGRWTVDFAGDEDAAVGILRQDVGSRTVRGTFLTTTGDYRFLAGGVEGDRLTLSCFDGAHAFLFVAERKGADELVGVFHSGNWWRDTWTARRDPEARLADAFAQTSWEERFSLADLAFPDLEGNLRSLADPTLVGRATLLVLFGSWCPNCHDEAPYLVELHERYAARGLSILGVAFELTGDFAADARQVELFRERYRVPYPLFLAGTANKAAATAAFGAVDFLRSYPTTVFLDSAARVRAIHSGYAGPATGVAHEELRREFEARIEELLANEPAGDDEVWGVIAGRQWWSDVELAGATYEFVEEDGERHALYTLRGSGVPVLSTTKLPVRMVGDAVWIGERVWKLDRRAGVLLDPLDFGTRLRPRATAAPSLTERGLATEAAFVRALSDPDPFVRREAIVALTREREPLPQGIPEVVPLLADEDDGVRIAAAWAVGWLHEVSGREKLLELLSTPSTRLRREVVRSLARMASDAPGVLLPLRGVEEDSDPVVRAIARRALGREE